MSKRGNEDYLKRRKQMVLDIKTNTPCADCGHFFDPRIMEFDHVRGRKVAGVSEMVGQRSWSNQALMDEIAKCDIVCSNCHKLRSFNSGKFSGKHIDGLAWNRKHS